VEKINYFSPFYLNFANLKDVSTPFGKKKNQFHLLNIWLMILPPKLTLNKKDVFAKVINVWDIYLTTNPSLIHFIL